MVVLISEKYDLNREVKMKRLIISLFVCTTVVCATTINVPADYTTIRFSVASTQSSQIQIFDITGRLVETLIDEPLTQGEHEIVWNAGSQPSGVYFVRLQSCEFVQNQKVILLK